MTRALALLLTALLATPALAQSVIATWDEVTLDVDGEDERIAGYHIYYDIDPGEPYAFGFATGATARARIDDLENGQTYYFAVRAIDRNDNEAVETLCDGLDNDCDGETDEGAVCGGDSDSDADTDVDSDADLDPGEKVVGSCAAGGGSGFGLAGALLAALVPARTRRRRRG